MPIISLQEERVPSECYIFKHSTRCGMSCGAAEVVQNYQFPLPLYWINVIEQRPLSNWVEREFSVRHESPQLLRVRGGKIDKVWNHREIERAIDQGDI